MKPVLIGISNPHPVEALSPSIAGTTGWRLWKMLNDQVPWVTQQDYMRAFERQNFRDGYYLLPRKRTVVLLGDEVRRAYGFPRLFLHPIAWGDSLVRQIPHPSGRNPFYNDPAARALVGQLLADLYTESTKRRTKWH